MADEIGTPESLTGSIERVAESGVARSHYSRKSRFHGFGNPVENIDIVETYIPVMAEDGQTIGVFETYADVTPEMAAVRRSTWYAVSIAAVIFGLLFVALFLIARQANKSTLGYYEEVRRSDVRIKRQNEQIEREMTGRIRAEEELGDYTLLLQRTLETIEHGICVYDRHLKLVAWNQKYIEMTGHAPARVQRGRSAYDLIHDLAVKGQFGDEDPAVSSKEREQYYFASGRHSVEERQREDGRIILIERTPMADGGYVSCFTDVTDQRSAERDLMRAKENAELANRVKTEFLANVSHELRTPLNSIIGFSQILQGDVTEAKRREYAYDIMWSGTHLLEVINDILDVSKIEAGEMQLHFEPVDIRLLFDECRRMFYERLEGANLRMEINAAEELQPIPADPLRLKQALFNLLSNAVKFTGAGGQIRLSARRADGGGAEIAVANTGIGIAAEDLQKVMQPFGQARNVHDRPHEGSGLGLFLVKSIVELHGGELALESEQGVGTVVTISLPSESAGP